MFAFVYSENKPPPHPVSNGQNRQFYIAQETDNVPKLKLSL